MEKDTQARKTLNRDAAIVALLRAQKPHLTMRVWFLRDIQVRFGLTYRTANRALKRVLEWPGMEAWKAQFETELRRGVRTNAEKAINPNPPKRKHAKVNGRITPHYG